MALRSGLSLTAFAAAGVSMLTGGPPSVAIFRRGSINLRRSRGARLLGCSRGSIVRRRQNFGAAGDTCSVDAVFARVGRRNLRRVSRCGRLGLCGRSHRLVPGFRKTAVSGFAASGADASSGFSAATCPVSAGATAAGAGAAMSVTCSTGATAAGAWFGAFCSEAAGSTRSIASTGRVASLCCANIVSGAARHTGCWQIPHAPRAAGPPRQARRPGSTSSTRSPRTEKRKPGSMKRRIPPFAFVSLRRAFEHRGTRWTTELAAFATHRAPPARSESG